MRSQLHEGKLNCWEGTTAQTSSSAEVTPTALDNDFATSTDVDLCNFDAMEQQQQRWFRHNPAT